VFAPVPLSVWFLSRVTGESEVFRYDRVRPLCEQIGECVGAFAQLFPDFDWSPRTESWTTPELPT
jgi:hypothetical protein